jgi:hypothetical protein
MRDYQSIIKDLAKVPDGIRGFKQGARAFMDGLTLDENPFARMSDDYSHLVDPWNQGFQMAQDKGLQKPNQE